MPRLAEPRRPLVRAGVLFFLAITTLLISAPVGSRPAKTRDPRLAAADQLWEHASDHFSAGRYQAALDPARRAVLIRQELLGYDHPQSVESTGEFSLMLREAGDLAGAEIVVRFALAQAEKTPGYDPAGVSALLNHLGNALAERGKYGEAEAVLRRALAIDAKKGGRDHFRTANNLGLLLTTTGQLDEAEALFAGLSRHPDDKSMNDMDAGTVANNTAQLMMLKGDYAQAERFFLVALAVIDRARGSDHPDFAIVLSNLASVMEAKGDFDDAVRLKRKALGILEKALGPRHPNVGTALNNLARSLAAAGRLSEAERIQTSGPRARRADPGQGASRRRDFPHEPGQPPERAQGIRRSTGSPHASAATGAKAAANDTSRDPGDSVRASALAHAAAGLARCRADAARGVEAPGAGARQESSICCRNAWPSRGALIGTGQSLRSDSALGTRSTDRRTGRCELAFHWQQPTEARVFCHTRALDRPRDLAARAIRAEGSGCLAARPDHDPEAQRPRNRRLGRHGPRASRPRAGGRREASGEALGRSRGARYPHAPWTPTGTTSCRARGEAQRASQ